MNIFAHGLLGDATSEHYQIPFTPNLPHPVTVDLGFNRNVHIPHAPSGTNSRSDADYKFAAVDHLIPAGESFSVFPGQRPMTDGTQNSIPSHLPKAAYVNPASDAGFFAGKDTSPRFNGANPTAFPVIFSSASSLGVRPAQPPSSTFPPYPPSYSSTHPSVSYGPAYEESKREPSRPISRGQNSALSSSEPLERPAAHPGLPKECYSPDKTVRTLRSVRTRFGDVYAEHELYTDRVGGRWVCQCGSTFARDSDWERHAMHSLSHSAGGGFDCNICDISFTRSDAMFRHRRKKHGDPKPSTLGSREREDERARLSRDRQQLPMRLSTPKSRGHAF